MRKLLMCSMLIAAALPSMAIAAPGKTRIEQSNCRLVGHKIIRTVDGESYVELIDRCDVGPGGAPV
jgi:hypothetical protein